MQIWTGKFCRFNLGQVLLVIVLLAGGCKTGQTAKQSSTDEVAGDVSLKPDREAVEQLRKEIPEETKKSNDRLAEILQRWKAQKTEPERLREKFDDEIRKLRVEQEKKQHRAREDFSREQSDRRKEFLDKLKSERDAFYATKPKSDQRSDFVSKQSEQRDRFFGDQRDARSDFDSKLRDERREFEEMIKDRRSEFTQEYPEYVKLYAEMKERQAKEREEKLANPQNKGAWPYKYPGEENAAASPTPEPQGANAPSGKGTYNVNKGGDGWPSSDPNEFNQLPSRGGH